MVALLAFKFGHGGEAVAADVKTEFFSDLLSCSNLSTFDLAIFFAALASAPNLRAAVVVLKTQHAWVDDAFRFCELLDADERTEHGRPRLLLRQGLAFRR